MPLIIKHHIANLMTMTNICLGILSIFLMIRYQLMTIPMVLIFISAIIDRYDGKVARLFNSESELGKQLDTLSDVVVFVIAPIVFICHFHMFNQSFMGYIVILVYALAGLFRLARFNTETQSTHQKGLPITVAAVILLAYLIFHQIFLLHDAFLVSIVVIISFFMIHSFSWKKI